MEWYYVLAMVAGFMGIVGLLAYLGAKGIVTKKTMTAVSAVLTATTGAANAIADATDNQAIDVMAMVMKLVDRAVLAAENAFYNDEITADQRHSVCMAELNNFLEASEIQISVAQRQAVDGLIAAACEEMGHGLVEQKQIIEDMATEIENYEEG